jgi:hypothetical protein
MVADAITIMRPPAAHAQPRLNPCDRGKREAGGCQDLGDPDEQLKPARQSRVHLLRDRGRREQHHGPLRKEDHGQQDLKGPHEPVFPHVTSTGIRELKDHFKSLIRSRVPDGGLA